MYYDFKLNKQDSSYLNFTEKVFNNNQWQDATFNPRSFNEFISGYLCLENFRYTDFISGKQFSCVDKRLGDKIEKNLHFIPFDNFII